MLEMMVLRFSMQGENFSENTNDKCHVFTIQYVGGRYSRAHECQASFVYTLVNFVNDCVT
jgi:hypothetical protein